MCCHRLRQHPTSSICCERMCGKALVFWFVIKQAVFTWERARHHAPLRTGRQRLMAVHGRGRAGEWADPAAAGLAAGAQVGLLVSRSHIQCTPLHLAQR